MPARKTYRIENQRQAPVELHVAAEAVVLGAEDAVEVSDLTGQIEELARRGIVRIEAVPVTPPSERAPARKATAKRSPASKRSAAPGSAPSTKKAAQEAPSTRSRRGGN